MLEVAIVFHEVVVFSELARLEYGKELDCVEIEDCTASTVVNSAAKAETEFEKYRVIQDRLFISDFDKYMLELEENAKK